MSFLWSSLLVYSPQFDESWQSIGNCSVWDLWLLFGSTGFCKEGYVHVNIYLLFSQTAFMKRLCFQAGVYLAYIHSVYQRCLWISLRNTVFP